MAAALGHIGSFYAFYLILCLKLLIIDALSTDVSCSQNCTCTIDTTDCSNMKLTQIPTDLPERTVRVNLSHNKLAVADMNILSSLPNLREVRLEHNELTSLPVFGDGPLAITSLSLHHNKISSVQGSRLQTLRDLLTLDLSNNDLMDLREHCFPPGLHIRELLLSSNKIVHLEFGTFRNLASTLQVLKLSRNRLTQLPVKGLELPRLTQLDLSRNRLRLIEGLTFQGLSSLEVLKLQKNNISRLTDGAFWGLAHMRVLHLDYNNLTEVNSGSLYGLESLQHLHLSNNSISTFNPEGWAFCDRLRELHLAHNNLTKLSEGSFVKLVNLQSLRLSHNSLSHIAEGAFRGLSALRLLELDHNDLSGVIEDATGAFVGLESLRTLTLCGNRIKSVARKAFSGLEALQHLNLRDNVIRTIQPDTFSKMKDLHSLEIQSDSFLCDCQLSWFPEWLVTQGLQAGVQATCAHPSSLQGTSVFQAPPQSFVCDDLAKPHITAHPVATSAVVGEDVRLTCTAVSGSTSVPVTLAWRKDQEALEHAEVETRAQPRAPDGAVTDYTAILHLRSVAFQHEGRYQCVVSNHFGSAYSNKARLSVSVLPSFVKTPRDVTVRTGAKARLECAARGHPPPQVAWQKDGGTDFPAARERRMQVMPDDDVFFIMDVKPEDTGVYSCTARNTAGTVSANVTLAVLETPHLAQGMEDRSVVVGETVALQCKALGSPPPRIAWLRGEEPLRPSDRYHFTPGSQLLVISGAALEDAGRYTCVMSNPLGTERAHCQLSVLQRSGGACSPHAGPTAVTVGIVVITVVSSIVATSLVWVCIIYQTRKKSEECSINTDETIIPPDVPSYLSSQGTLSERQDMCIRVESSGGPQAHAHRHSNGGLHFPIVCADCMENCTGYSRPSGYLPQVTPPTSGPEYQQTQTPSTCASHRVGDMHCNGTPAFPSNHNTASVASHTKHSDGTGCLADRAGVVSSFPSLDDTQHHSVPTPPTPARTAVLFASELTKTLLPRDRTHTSRACPSEGSPLRRASD
ncbi:leucine-rich repeats and immunoglobulin-like domains protein 1 isoform X1 [Electrophorus electricus]|uniref:Ig-like domain-containing protein n=2 Tax=Electrophorus electricus TaxID=8005 RepID=A0AAY5F3M7_ELEEL|nr:leucine-rich repeats and immunoglobulin-like domains protein 1 isoform X1 [Electrophorus electricus]